MFILDFCNAYLFQVNSNNWLIKNSVMFLFVAILSVTKATVGIGWLLKQLRCKTKNICQCEFMFKGSGK